MLRFDKATYLSLFVKFILSKILSNSMWRSAVLLFPELINSVFILIYNFFEFIIWLHTFLVISISQWKECMIDLFDFIYISDVLPTFTCASAISNLWRVSLEVNILILLPFCCLLKSRSLSTITLFCFDIHFQEFLF